MPADITPDPDGNLTPIAPSGADVLNAASALAFLQRLANADAAMGRVGGYSTSVSGASNITGASVAATSYIKIRHFVIVWGQLSYTNSGSGNKSVNLSVATTHPRPGGNFTQVTQAFGVFNENSSGVITSGAIRANVSTETVGISWNNSDSSGARTAMFLFVYQMSELW